MDKDIFWFAENICGLNLTENQKEILTAVQNSKDRGQKIFLSYGRTWGIGLLKNTFIAYENWLKDQKIAELENALVLAVEELDDAKDMLRDAGKNEWASLLNTSADYFKSKAKGKK